MYEIPILYLDVKLELSYAKEKEPHQKSCHLKFSLIF